MKHYVIPIFVPHLGCPHQCVFCNQAKITAVPKNRLIRGEDVRRIARMYLASLPAGEKEVEISFYGGTFTAIPALVQEELLAAAHDFLRQGLIQHIRCSTRPDFISPEVLERAGHYGLDIIELGVQSLDETVLQKSARGHTASDAKAASDLIRNAGITLGHQIMPGLPGADPASDLATARASIAMAPDLVRIYPTLVIRDTPLEKSYRRGQYTPYALEDAIRLSSAIMSLYESAGIKILRVGLQATDDLSPGKDLVAGPWHPAFRELCLSQRLNDRISRLLAQEPAGCELLISPRDISVLYAGKKRFFEANRTRLNKVRQSTGVPQGQVIVIKAGGSVIASLCI